MRVVTEIVLASKLQREEGVEQHPCNIIWDTEASTSRYPCRCTSKEEPPFFVGSASVLSGCCMATIYLGTILCSGGRMTVCYLTILFFKCNCRYLMKPYQIFVVTVLEKQQAPRVRDFRTGKAVLGTPLRVVPNNSPYLF